MVSWVAGWAAAAAAGPGCQSPSAGGWGGLGPGGGCDGGISGTCGCSWRDGAAAAGGGVMRHLLFPL